MFFSLGPDTKLTRKNSHFKKWFKFPMGAKLVTLRNYFVYSEENNIVSRIQENHQYLSQYLNHLMHMYSRINLIGLSMFREISLTTCTREGMLLQPKSASDIWWSPLSNSWNTLSTYVTLVEVLWSVHPMTPPWRFLISHIHSQADLFNMFHEMIWNFSKIILDIYITL